MIKETLEDKEPMKEIDDSPDDLMEDFKPIENITTKIKNREMLLTYKDLNDHTQDFLPTGIVGMVVATGGIGKTYLLADLAVSVVTGKTWLSHFDVVGKELRVALILGEEDRDEITRRIQKIVLKEKDKSLSSNHKTAIQKELFILPMKGKSGKFNEGENDSAWYEKLIIKLKEEQFDLVIFDPASQFMADKSEVDNFSGTQFIKKLEQIINLHKNHKTTVLVAHHTSQSNVKASHQHSGRGSTALSDGSRWILNLGQIPQKTNKTDSPSWDINILENYVGFHHVKSSYTKKHSYSVIKRKEGGEGEFEKLIVKNKNGWSEFLTAYGEKEEPKKPITPDKKKKSPGERL